MSHDSMCSDPDERILAHFVADLEGTTDAATLVAEYAARHPHMVRKLQDFVVLNGALSEFRGAPGDPPPSRLGEFRIVRKLAAGGMGTIYEAIQEPLNRRVAVKTIRSDFPSPESAGPVSSRAGGLGIVASDAHCSDSYGRPRWGPPVLCDALH